MNDNDRRQGWRGGGGSADADGVAPRGPAPGKRTLIEGLTRSIPSVEQPVYRKVDGGDVTGGAETAISAASSAGGEALPETLRGEIEAKSGADLGDVRVHTGAESAAAASAVGAKAFAVGQDLHFGDGHYDPSSRSGQHLIAHEAAHAVQQRGGAPARQDKLEVSGESDPAELEADRFADSIVGNGGPVALTSGGAGVQRKTNPIPSARLNKLAVIGDGTAANRGMKVSALDAYVTGQADWFTDPSFLAADREHVWTVLHLLRHGAHVVHALGNFLASEIAALPDRTALMRYVAGFDSAEQTIQLTKVAPTFARALVLGQAIVDLEAFVPAPVMRHVIPEKGLTFLVDRGKIPELKKYYTTFSPTLEKAEEWDHIELLLIETVGAYANLAGWISDLHIFTIGTRATLRVNVADTSRARPVMLVLMSATDWNTAFLQSTGLQATIANGKNLALVVQGRATMADVTAKVKTVAATYGQGGRLGQVVMAGHGSDTSMEMASNGANPWLDKGNDRVAYDQQDLDSKDPVKNGTEALIDTVLNSMDPNDANLVFAGCLINSHDIDAKTNVSGNAAAIQKALAANIAKHPNLAEYVRGRMAANKVKGTLAAANASTVFDTLNLDAAGKAQLSNVDDPAIAGTKLQYVQAGTEPEGALRAAIECCADPAIGVVKTTTEMRAHVAALAGSTDWWETITRLGYELCLPAAPAHVNVGAMIDLVHRIRTWFDCNITVNPQSLADNVKATEATKVFTAMLASLGPGELAVGIHQAWMKHVPAQAAPFMAELTTSTFTAETFAKQFARGIVDKHLGTLLPIGAPTHGQMILALTIADADGAKMPKQVRDFLRAAAGGKITASFPAALKVTDILPSGELTVLENIGLSAKSKPPAGSDVDGNADVDQDGKNETHIDVATRKTAVKAVELNVRAKPNGAIIDTIKKSAIVFVMGETGPWSMIDHGGKIGFVWSEYLER